MQLKYILLFLASLWLMNSMANEDVNFVYDPLLNEYKCKNDSCNSIQYLLSHINYGTEDSILLASYYHYAGVYYYNKKEFIVSIKYNKKAAELRVKFNGGLYWKSLRNIGINYYEIDYYHNAYKFVNQAYQIYSKEDNDNTIVLKRNIANCLIEFGDYEYAENLMREAIKLEVSDKQLIMAMNTLANILYQVKKIDEAIPILEKSLKINDQIKSSLTDVKYLKNRTEGINFLGWCFDEIGESERAIKLYKKRILELNKKDFEHLATLYNSIATSLNSEKKYKEAINKLNLSLDIWQEGVRKTNHYYYAAAYENLADNYTALQQFDTALLHYQKALINLTNNFRDEIIFQNPNPKDTSLFIYSNLDIIRVLHLKATASYKYYQQNNNQKYLTLANQCYQTAFNFHDKLQKDISTENSRLFQAKNIVSYIENALKVAYELQQNDQLVGEAAFRFMEKNKATVLLQSMNEADALQFANLPDSLIEQEKKMKLHITEYKRQQNDAIEEVDNNEIERLNTLLFEQQQQYNQLINNLENNYPNYYRLKYQQNQTQLADVQNTLDKKTALVEYFVGDSTIYILSVQQGQSKLYQINKPTDWQQTIENFRQSLTLKDTSQSNSSDVVFVQSAAKIYDWLLKEVLTDLTNDITTLQIIPDGVLNYIPFGVLLSKIDTSQKVDYKTLPYLLKEKAIGYSYSSALWLEQQQGELKTKDKITYAGFAPKYGVESGQFKLPFANESVKENADLFKGKAFVENQATGSQFKKSAPQFNILQLAMHVLMDDKKPMETKLLFNQTKDSLSAALRAADLYNMQLKTNLAVLGACNTGSGQLQNGEGVMSLSRAFTYAGTSSLVMSLWSIVDESTAVIVNQFFKNIKQGTPKHRALQQAKLHFLDNAFEDKSHPKYWAGLVVSGNQKALVHKTHYMWWALFAALLCAMGFGLMRSKS